MGCRTGGNQNCRDSRLEGFRTGEMQEREIQERRDAEREESRLEGYRKGWFRTVEIRNGRDARVDRRDKGKLGGRTGGMQD